MAVRAVQDREKDSRYDSVVEEIKRGNRFLVISHTSPEGDAVGSTIGLSLALRAIGKEVTSFLEDPVPEVFRFLPGADAVTDTLGSGEGYDAVFAVDCGDKKRLGKQFNALDGWKTIINIDHHRTNDQYGDINVVDPDACAAGEMIFDLVQAASIEMTKGIAENLYVAIHTDTGSFRYSATSPEAFRKAGALVECGVDPWEISQQVYESYPLERLQLLSRVLGTLDRSDGGEITSMVVTRKTMEEFNATGELLEGFINFARSIKGVKVAIIFKEIEADNYRVSFRSKGAIDVASVAHSFGGGGHINAAGCSVEGPLDEVRAKVMSSTAAAVKGGTP